MTSSQGHTAELLAVHVAAPQPAPLPLGAQDSQPGMGRQLRGTGGGHSRFADDAIDWKRHGLQPRWLGMETVDCAAAIDPSIFHARGADELKRFLAGAADRDETAVTIATIGDSENEFGRSPFGSSDASILLPGLGGMISGRRLPTMTRPTLASDIAGADKDLGLRLLNRAVDAPWWSIALSATSHEFPGGHREVKHPGGELHPILVDSLGDPVVAAWVPDAGDQRWYIIPDATDPNSVLDWLISQAVPELVPGALRRVRSPHATTESLQTDDESKLTNAIARLDESYERERAKLAEELAQAKKHAEPIRHGLLFGTGSELVKAVAAVLIAAGLHITDIDELLGDTVSADLLAEDAVGRRLVEVKSAGGNAPEKLVAALENHLRTWPQLRPEAPVLGGVLIVNHQHKTDPYDRSAQVFNRQEFVAALPVRVISTRQLFDWWRASDWTSIREAVQSAPSQ